MPVVPGDTNNLKFPWHGTRCGVISRYKLFWKLLSEALNIDFQSNAVAAIFESESESESLLLHLIVQYTRVKILGLVPQHSQHSHSSKSTR